MPRKTFDTLPLLQQLGPFFRTHFKDTDKLKVVWEAMIRLSDDLLANAAYTNLSKSVASVPSRLIKPLLYRKLDGWVDTGANHAHRALSLDGSGLSTLYTGVLFDQDTTDVFLNGAQLDDVGQSTDYRLINTPDAAQVLGTQPRGTRVEFDYVLPLGSRVDLFGEAVLSFAVADADGSTTETVFDHDVEELSVRVVVEAVDITRDVTLTIGGGDTEISWTAGRSFYAGTVLRVIDTVGVAVYERTVTAATDVVALGAVVDPSSTVEVVVEVPLDAVTVVDGQLRIAGTTVPPELEFVVSDDNGSYGFHTTRLQSVYNLSREFDSNTLSVLFQGAEVTDPFTATDDTVTLTSPFFAGTRYRIEARSVIPHSHAQARVTTVGAGTTVTLPGAAEPFEFDGADPDGDYPVQVFLNDGYVHADTYTISSPTTLEFATPLPGGSVVDIYYGVDAVVLHKHRRTRTTVINDVRTFRLGHTQDDEPYRLVADSGVNISSADPIIALINERTAVVVRSLVPAGTIMRTRSTQFRRPYEHALAVDEDSGVDDTRITQADTLQNGIDELDDISPGGWTTQLLWDEGFKIEDGVVSSTAVIEDAWFENAQINLETGYDNFGRLIDFRRDNTVDYLNRLQVLFSTYQGPATRSAIENAACVVMGSPFTQQPAKVLTVTGTGEGREVTVTNTDGSTEVLALSATIPDRLPSGNLRRFHAVSSYARLFDPSEASFPLLPIVAEQFSDDFVFGKMMDRFEAAEIDRTFSPARPFDSTESSFEDFGVDFTEEGVQAGDFVFVYVGVLPIPALVTTVEQHKLTISQLTPPAATGYDFGGYSEGGYSGVTLVEEYDRYVVFLRQRRRKDTHYFLDEAPEEDRAVINAALVPLFRTFLKLVELRWETLSPQEQDDLAVFLERVRPATTKIVAFSRAFNEDGLVDPMSVTTSEAVTMTDVLDYFYAGLTSISGSDPASPGIGYGDGFAGGFLG